MRLEFVTLTHADRQASVALLDAAWPSGRAAHRAIVFAGATSRGATTRCFGVREDGELVGFAKVANTVKDAEDVVLTSVCVDARRRGQGLGGRLVAHVCAACVEGGKSYVYLWCQPTVVPFYIACGFRTTRDAAAAQQDRAVLKGVELSALDALFGTKNGTTTTTTTNAWVWMKKRVRWGRPAAEPDVSGAPRWVRQVGPSCGFSALSMARAFVVGTRDDDDDVGRALRAAVDAGTTTDGELFDIATALRVAREHFSGGEGCAEWRMLPRPLATHALRDALRLTRAAVVLAYDRESGNGEVGRHLGKRAHYAVLYALSADETAASARHGMSKVVVSASLKDWTASCNQLSSIGDRFADDLVHPYDLAGGALVLAPS